MATSPITAQIQGVTRDLTRANGSYDAVDLGRLSPGRLAEVLAAMTLLSPPEGDGDLCWPNLLVTGPMGDAAFSLADESGRLVTEDGADVTDLGDAVSSVTGVPFTGVIPAHRRGAAAGAAARAHPHRKTPKAAQAARAATPEPGPREPKADARPREGRLDPKAKELVELIRQPVPLKEYRARFAYLMAGPPDPELRRITDQLQSSDLLPEQKLMVQNLEPRAWAILHPGMGRRFLAFLIDVPLFFVFLGLGLAAIVSASEGSSEASQGMASLAWIVVSYFVYFGATELLFSASPGGLVTGLRVVDERGRRPGLGLCVKRQFARIFRALGAALTALLFSKARTTNARMAGGGMAARIGAGGGSEVVLALLAGLLLCAPPTYAQEKPLVVVVHGIGGGERQAGWGEDIRNQWGVGVDDFREVSFSYDGRTEPGSFTDFSRKANEWASSVQTQIQRLAQAHPGREIVLVSHSWGTVTTKMALGGADTNEGEIPPIRLPEGSKISKWVTIGSPLGRDQSQRNDAPAEAKPVSLGQLGIVIPPGKPTVVQGEWVNMTDPLDPVSGPSRDLKGARNVSVPGSGYSWKEWAFIPGRHTAIWNNAEVKKEVTGSTAAAAQPEPAAPPAPAGAGESSDRTSGHFPILPDGTVGVNGMSVRYALAGVRVNRSEQTGGQRGQLDWTRSLLGWFAGSTLRVSGTAIADRDHPAGTPYGSFPSRLEVVVGVDGKTQTYSAETEPNQGPWNHPFDVSVPIPQGAQQGMFRITLTFVNPRYGDRSVIVEGDFFPAPQDLQVSEEGSQ